MRLAIVGVMPLFSILWTAAGESPARSASWASDQPRSARALATLAPSSETVRSISGGRAGAERSWHVSYSTRLQPQPKALLAPEP